MALPGPHLLYLSDTPPPHVKLRGADGFVGLVGYSLMRSRQAVVTVPMQYPFEARNGARQLVFEPELRQSIGIWSNNCAPRRRRHLIDLLLASGLAVESYGRCRHNMNASDYWSGQRIDGAAPHSPAVRACRRHRLMLADESHRCPGAVPGSSPRRLDSIKRRSCSTGADVMASTRARQATSR